MSYRVLVATPRSTGHPLYRGRRHSPHRRAPHPGTSAPRRSCSCRGGARRARVRWPWWIVRRSLRPLDEMAATAGAMRLGRRPVSPGGRPPTSAPRWASSATPSTRCSPASRAPCPARRRAQSEERLRRDSSPKRLARDCAPPLPRSIRGYSELFDRARDRPEDLATSMRHIREEANRMSVLVDDLLLLARLDHERPVELEEVDLTGIVTAAGRHAARLSAPRRGSISLAGARAQSRSWATPTVCARSSTTSCQCAGKHTPARALPSTCASKHRDGDTATAMPRGLRPRSGHRRRRDRRTSSSPSTAPTPPGHAPPVGPAWG